MNELWVEIGKVYVFKNSYHITRSISHTTYGEKYRTYNDHRHFKRPLLSAAVYVELIIYLVSVRRKMFELMKCDRKKEAREKVEKCPVMMNRKVHVLAPHFFTLN